MSTHEAVNWQARDGGDEHPHGRLAIGAGAAEPQTDI